MCLLYGRKCFLQSLQAGRATTQALSRIVQSHRGHLPRHQNMEDLLQRANSQSLPIASTISIDALAVSCWFWVCLFSTDPNGTQEKSTLGQKLMGAQVSPPLALNLDAWTRASDPTLSSFSVDDQWTGGMIWEFISSEALLRKLQSQNDGTKFLRNLERYL